MSPPAATGSNSTMSYTTTMSPLFATTLPQLRRTAQLRRLRPLRLYFNYVVSPVTWSLRSTCCPVALALLHLRHASGRTVSLLDLFSGRTGSTTPTSCIRSHGLLLSLLSDHTSLPTSCVVITDLTVASATLRQHQLVVDYFGYSPWLVLARKLVKGGCHTANN
jgi:hypothetical protein